MAGMDALFAEMGDSTHNNDDDAFTFDEDLSDEELAAKNAAKDAEMEESAAERPVQHGEALVVESTVEIDETPIDSFSQDPTYMKIWEEMTDDLVNRLNAIKASDDTFEDRRIQTERQVDGLLHAAGQMGFDSWVSLLEDFAFDCPSIPDEGGLVEAIDALLRDVEALKNGDAPSATPIMRPLLRLPRLLRQRRRLRKAMWRRIQTPNCQMIRPTAPSLRKWPKT